MDTLEQRRLGHCSLFVSRAHAHSYTMASLEDRVREYATKLATNDESVAPRLTLRVRISATDRTTTLLISTRRTQHMGIGPVFVCMIADALQHNSVTQQLLLGVWACYTAFVRLGGGWQYSPCDGHRTTSWATMASSS